MKLLEFFGQINELTARLFLRDNKDGSAAGVYGTSGASIPTHIIVSADGSDLKYTDDVYIVSLQPANLKKFKRELNKKQYMGQGITTSDEMYLAMIDLIENMTLTGEHIRKIGKNLPTKKIVELNGRPRIYKYLTTDLGLPAQVFQNTLGELPEMDEGDFTQFHNARLIVPDTMKPANIKAATATLEAVYQRLDQAGEIDVFGGDIRFVKLPTYTAGQYNVTNRDILVNQKLSNVNMSSLYTLLHEYGHKKMYELMTPEAVKELQQKYSELLGSGEQWSEDVDYASAVMDAASQFQAGQHLTYIGRKRAYKRDPNYVIKSITPDLYANLTHADDTDRVVVKYPMINLLDSKKWKADGIDLTPPARKAKEKMKSDDWFPTEYSQTNPQEWWAELYAFYTLGNLSGEPAAWMRSMLHGNTTETVGSNDGEISSEGDPMPPPQRGNEEGKPEWEWTDPYHSSGTENAVLSNTP